VTAIKRLWSTSKKRRIQSRFKGEELLESEDLKKKLTVLQLKKFSARSWGR